jgi:hypothetical protein
MSIEKTRAHIVSSIWQALAQSEVDLKAVPQDQQDLLVNKIADSLLATVDNLLEEAQPKDDPPIELEEDEKNLWEGRPFLSLVEKYVVTTERLKVIKGMISRDVENFEMIRIQDIDLKQTVAERMMGIGDITIRGADSSDPMIVLRNVKGPETVYEVLRKAWLDARKRYGLQFREFM